MFYNNYNKILVSYSNAPRTNTVMLVVKATYKVTCHREFYLFCLENLVVIPTKLGFSRELVFFKY